MNMQTTIDTSTTAETNSEAANYGNFTATYSPDDNKMRLYSVYRLDTETYAEAKRLGFKWAPKQELFVAPMWTPAREDFLLSLAGEIGDEDKSLVERAEERAERFEDYSDKRANEAARAHEAVKHIADGIPFGQPILVGHHSERRARKDAQKIENGMRRAVNLFETSEYWTQRAAGALRHAKYKEIPGVRYRRIKKIEADKRAQERIIKEADGFIKAYTDPAAADVTLRDGRNMRETLLLSWHGGLSSEGQQQLERGELALTDALARAIRSHELTKQHAQRWIDHYNNRIAYERAMLDEKGGIAADQFNIEAGGMVLICGEWLTVVRVNRVADAIVSVTTNARYVRVSGIEEVKDYRAPTAEQKEALAKATKLAPLCNYPGEGFLNITAKEWDGTYKDYKGTQKQAANDEHAAHRVRFIIRGGKWLSVFITDKPRKDAPKPTGEASAPVVLPRERVVQSAPALPKEPEPNSLRDSVQDMKQALKVGVKAVAAPSLFQTPVALADRVIDDAEPDDGLRWLEPSAGPGRLCQAILRRVDSADVVAVEYAQHIAQILTATTQKARVINADFLTIDAAELGLFDRVVMNPPFENAADIAHIKKAASMLKAGGILVAICANAPRQINALAQWARDSGGYFEKLPEGTFKESGTNVNTAILQYRA